MKENNLKIEYLRTGSLTPYENNTRKHTEEDINEIMLSIQHFGFNDPIGIWSDKNIIIEGHGRLVAAKRLGIKEVPCIRLDHLSDEERREYGILHNKTAELSRWDFEKLDAEIEALGMREFPSFADLDKKLEDTPEEQPEEERQKIFTFETVEAQYQIVMRVVDYIEKNIPMEHTYGNKNKKSNAIFEGVYLWMESQGLI